MYCHECGASVEEQARFCPVCGTRLDLELMSARTERTRTAARRRIPAAVAVLLTLIVSVVVLVLQALAHVAFALVVPTGSSGLLTVELLCSVVGSLLAAGGVLVLGGLGILRIRSSRVRAVLRHGRWILILYAAMMVYDFATLTLAGEFSLSARWLPSTLETLATCLAGGLFEELLFRGIVLGGLVCALGSRKRGLLAAALVASLLFGCAHISWSELDYGSVTDVAQALLKAAQTATLGFFLASEVVREHDLYGVALLHGLGNFLLLLTPIGLMGEEYAVSYVNSGEEAAATIVVYLIMIGCYLPFARGAWCTLRAAEARSVHGWLFGES